MTLRRRASPRSFRWPGVLLNAVLVAILAVCVADAPGAAAQSTQALLAQRRAEYAAARSEYDAARRAFDAANQPFSESIAKGARARAAGDQAALEQALSEAQDRAKPLQAADTRLTRAQAAFNSARQALVEIIGRREEEVFKEMEAASSTQQRDSLNTTYQNLSGELHVLEAEAGSFSGTQPVVGLLIPPDPRDSPEDRLRKARRLELFAAQMDTTIQQTDTTIKELQGRLRRQQQRADFMAPLNRFDDTRLPVVTNAPPGEPATAADSTGVGARPLTLRERIEELQDYRKQLVTYRDNALERAREFRHSGGSGT